MLDLLAGPARSAAAVRLAARAARHDADASSGPSTWASRRPTIRWPRPSTWCAPGLAEAEEDGTLALAASTYDAGSDRLVPGHRPAAGPRVLDFAPLLRLERAAAEAGAARRCSRSARSELGAPVEIEFALTLAAGAAGPLRLPAGAADGSSRRSAVEVERGGARGADGRRGLDARRSATARRRACATSSTSSRRRSRRGARRRSPPRSTTLNRALVDAGRPYLLIGFGRWGSSTPGSGSRCAGTRSPGRAAIVEATLPG